MRTDMLPKYTYRKAENHSLRASFSSTHTSHTHTLSLSLHHSLTHTCKSQAGSQGGKNDRDIKMSLLPAKHPWWHPWDQSRYPRTCSSCAREHHAQFHAATPVWTHCAHHTLFLNCCQYVWKTGLCQARQHVWYCVSEWLCWVLSVLKNIFWYLISAYNNSCQQASKQVRESLCK